MFIFTKEEVLNRPLADMFHSDIRPIKSLANFSDEFDIPMTVKRKSMDTLSVNCHFIPVICIGRRTTHFLITFGSSVRNNSTGDTSTVIETLLQHQQTTAQSSTQPKLQQSTSEPRSSIYGIRRGSVDVRSITSENIRRTSLAKLSALPLEAPITKVI